MSTQTIKAPAGVFDSLLVQPRRGKRFVMVSPAVLDALRSVQSQLPPHLQLILTRGYEPETSTIWALRRLGRLLFTLLFWRRRRESEAIFHSNGHSLNGDHVDISIAVDGKALRPLPFGVFTPLFWASRRECEHEEIFIRVRSELSSAGFVIHANPIEALQIHCDFLP